jgi:hypothetical protein
VADRTVWKFNLDTPGVNDLGVTGRVVHVASQHDRLTIWVEVEVRSGPTLRVRAVGTGHPVPEGAEHRGSALLLDGDFVLHVYEHPAGSAPYAQERG